MNQIITDEKRELAIAAQAPIDIPPPSPTLAMIERAARDPSIDVAKLEKLMELAERAQAREAKAAYYAALSEMQDELPIIQERGEIKIGGQDKPGQKYALWEDINRAIKPILKTHGFALSFRVGQADGKITVTGILSHRLGHAEDTTIYLPTDTSGSKNAVQAVGSSTSYGKRYTASALLNLTSTGEDDDGKFGGSSGLIDETELHNIQALIERTGTDIEALCKYFKVAALPDITKALYPRVCQALNDKERKAKK